MKTTQPCFGVLRTQTKPVFKRAARDFPPADHASYVASVRALWAEPEREMRYGAIRYARAFNAFIVPRSLPLYRRLVVEGAWWDFVDETAVHLVGRAYASHRAAVRPVMERWILDGNLWIRRTAILCQLAHRDHTDARQLFRFCRRCAPEKDFFIRKAIGWALRAHARVDPPAVRHFLDENRGRLSALSFREAERALR